MKQKIQAVLSLLAVMVIVSECATVSTRHAATISLDGIHQTLATIQDSEIRLVCGRTSAPESPQCVPIETHRQIQGKLATAFALESRAEAVVRDLPDGDKSADVLRLLGDVGGLVHEVLTMIPQSPQRDSLVGVVNTGGGK